MNFDISWWIWFNVAVVSMLILDILWINRKEEKMSSKKAFLLTGIWVAAAILFGGLLHYTKGWQAALEFMTGYIIEESLSIDNLFVFLLIFQFFKVPETYRYRILMWGILGALIMRFGFIFAGIQLIQKIHWILYVFGFFLVVTGLLLFKKQERRINFEKNIIVTLLKKFMPVSDTWENGKFFVRINNKLHATPLFVVLLTVESTDLVFALDSIPAVFAVTLDPFIVYTCNALAILGLRPLFFVLQDMLAYFRLLHYGVCIILTFVGLKMLLAPFIKIPTLVSLITIVSVIGGSILLSILTKKKA